MNKRKRIVGLKKQAVSLLCGTILLALSGFTGCTTSTSSGMTQEESSYMKEVEGVHLPLLLSPTLADTVRERSIRWIRMYGLYELRSSSNGLIETVMPGTNLQDGYGYRVRYSTLDDDLVVKVEAYTAIGSVDETDIVRDITVAKMLALYIQSGTLPPNRSIGFEQGRR